MGDNSPIRDDEPEEEVFSQEEAKVTPAAAAQPPPAAPVQAPPAAAAQSPPAAPAAPAAPVQHAHLPMKTFQASNALPSILGVFH